MRSATGAKKRDGFATTARRVGLRLPWLSWLGRNPVGNAFFCVVAAARAGDIDDLGVRSAKTTTIGGSGFWQSKEMGTSALTTASLAVVISRPMPETAVRMFFWLTGPQFISTLSPAIAN